MPGRHHQRHDLPLPAGERADLLVEPVLQPRGNRSQALCCQGSQRSAGGPAQPRRPAAAGRHGEILQHRQTGGGAGAGILKHASYQARPGVFAPAGDVVAGQLHAAGIEPHRAGDRALQRALTRTIGADHHGKRSGRQRERHPIHRAHQRSAGSGEGDGGGVECEHAAGE